MKSMGKCLAVSICRLLFVQPQRRSGFRSACHRIGRSPMECHGVGWWGKRETISYTAWTEVAINFAKINSLEMDRGIEIHRNPLDGIAKEIAEYARMHMPDIVRPWALKAITDPSLQDVADTAERRLPEFTTATQAEKFKEQEKSVAVLRRCRQAAVRPPGGDLMIPQSIPKPSHKG